MQKFLEQSAIDGAKTLAVTIALAAMFSVGGAQAGKIDDKDKCVSSVEIVEEMLGGSDSGDKEKEMVVTLIELSKGLCDRSRFEDAEDALGVARGIMGTEEGAEKDKDDDKKT